MIIEPGSHATVVTRHCVDKLQLFPTNSSKLLNVKTLTGSKQISSSSVKIPSDDKVTLDAYVLDSNLMLDSKKNINVAKLWPTLDKKLAKEVKANIVKGKIDIVIGIDQLYGKISNTKIISEWRCCQQFSGIF